MMTQFPPRNEAPDAVAHRAVAEQAVTVERRRNLWFAISFFFRFCGDYHEQKEVLKQIGGFTVIFTMFFLSIIIYSHFLNLFFSWKSTLMKSINDLLFNPREFVGQIVKALIVLTWPILSYGLVYIFRRLLSYFPRFLRWPSVVIRWRQFLFDLANALLNYLRIFAVQAIVVTISSFYGAGICALIVIPFSKGNINIYQKSYLSFSFSVIFVSFLLLISCGVFYVLVAPRSLALSGKGKAESSPSL